MRFRLGLLLATIAAVIAAFGAGLVPAAGPIPRIPDVPRVPEAPKIPRAPVPIAGHNFEAEFGVGCMVIWHESTGNKDQACSEWRWSTTVGRDGGNPVAR
jgi:hypothetical protein